jgi:acetyl esterase
MHSKADSRKLDPEIEAVLDTLRGAPPMEAMTLQELRSSLVPVPLARRHCVGSTEDRVIHGEIPIRIYRPRVHRCDCLVIYFHGGGFVLGSVETHDHVSRLLCDIAGCTVMSVDYRLAPEHRFPAATDDCLAAVRWAGDNIDALAASPHEIILFGDSAGANLATVTTLRLRDEGGPRPGGQVLVYPVTNYHTPPTQSYLDNASGYSLTRAAMIRFWSDYLSDVGDALHPHASPLRAADLSGLPPALIMTAEFDPLRDEGEAYAAKLGEHGVTVTVIRLDGMIHGFLRMAAASVRARHAYDQIANWIHAPRAQAGTRS